LRKTADAASFIEPDNRTTMLNAVTDPLHRFPVFRTSDPEELRELSTTLFGAARIDLKNTDGFEARVNLIKLQETGLAFGATTADLVSASAASFAISSRQAGFSRATWRK
jgi:hypothetical protein